MITMVVAAVALTLSIFNTVRVTTPAGTYDTLAAGFVKSEGPHTAFTSAPTVVLPTDVSGVLTVPRGGTGVGTLSAGFVKTLGSTSAFISTALVNVSNETTGTLPTNRGGTGQITYTNGQLLIGNTGTGGLDKATLTAGFGMLVTEEAGEITLETTTNGLLVWVMREQKTAGTNGGAAGSAALERRAFTHEAKSSLAVSILNTTDGRIFLTPGTYRVHGWAIAYSAGAAFKAQVALCQAGTSSVYIYGDATHGLAGEVVKPSLVGILTLLESDDIDLEMSISVFGAATDKGLPLNIGTVEIYSFLEITWLH